MKYHSKHGSVIFIEDSDDEQLPLRNASPALSSSSSHTLGRTPTPAPPRISTSKRPFEPLSLSSQEAQGSPSKRRVVTPDPSVIHLDDDSDDNYLDDTPDPSVISLDDSENDLNEDEIIDHGLDLEGHRARIQNQSQRGKRPRSRQTVIPVRNAPVQHPFAEIQSYEWNGTPLRQDKTVELQDGTFLHIKAVIHNPYAISADGSHEVFLRGWLLKRCSSLGGLLEKRLNELCYIDEVDQDDPRPVQEQSVIEVPLAYVVKVRRLIRTNEPLPRQRYDLSFLPKDLSGPELDEHIRREECLYVRWQLTTIFPTAKNRIAFQKEGKYLLPTIRKLESLTASQCTKGHYIPAEILRQNWRGDTILGGSGRKPKAKSNPEPEPEPEHVHELLKCPNCGKGFDTAVSLVEHHKYAHEKGKGKETVNLSQDPIEKMRQRLQSVISLDEEDEASKSVPRKERRYTIGDGFCCSGGVSCAAKAAGLQVELSFDNDPNTQDTYRLNNLDTRHQLISVFDFAGQECKPREYFVDILHLSPPCKFFSPAKTHFGCKNDVANESALFCIHEMLKKCRPRIVTLEQTFGLIQNHPDHFNALIQQFTSSGYSISWQVIAFQNRGLAASRKRLIIVASCPGDTLPDLGEDTHCKDGDPSRGLKPFTSINSVLAQVPLDARNHDLAAARAPGNFAPWDASKLMGCLLTSGAPCHPNGERRLTLRELAAIQGFPLDHVFYGSKTAIQGMIGDAVPPVIFEQFLRRIVRHLEEEDGVVHVL